MDYVKKSHGEEEPALVVFRVWKDGGEVIALFPSLLWDDDGRVTAYEHVGQHCGVDYKDIISMTRPASPEEYESLYRELEWFGYVMRVCKRYVRREGE